MFTYRDFEGGTLGLAWTGDLKNAGGVCEKNGVRKKLNIVFVQMPGWQLIPLAILDFTILKVDRKHLTLSLSTSKMKNL